MTRVSFIIRNELKLTYKSLLFEPDGSPPLLITFHQEGQHQYHGDRREEQRQRWETGDPHAERSLLGCTNFSLDLSDEDCFRHHPGILNDGKVERPMFAVVQALD